MRPIVTCVLALALAGLGRFGLADQAVISAADLGAIPDDGQDDSAALAAAFAKCRGSAGARLVLAKGQYDLRFGDRRGPTLLARDCRDLTIDGQNATLMFSGVCSALTFRNVRGLTVKDLAIDWARPPFSVGAVVATGERSFDIQIEPEFPVAGGEPVGAFMQYDPQTRRPAARGLDVYEQVESTELLRPQVLRVKLKKAVAVKPGMLLVLRHQVYSHNAIDLGECDDVRIEDVTVHTTPGMGVHGSFLGALTIRRFNVVPRPRSRRVMSATADGMHFNCCYGPIVIEDCTFEGMGDDALNVHGIFMEVTQRAGERTVLATCRNNWILAPRPGDAIEFTDPATVLPYATGRVAEVTADRPAGNMRIEFADPLPERLKVGDAMGDAAWAPKLRVGGCTVRHNRARGFLVQTRDAVIENNRFEGCTGAGIHVTADFGYWRESIGTRNVAVRGNTFVGCNRGPAMAEAAVNVFAHVKDWRHAPQPGVHREVVIENNTIRDTDNSAVFIGATDGFVVRGNRIEQSCRAPTRGGGRDAIHLLNSRNGRIEGNVIPPESRGAGQQRDVGFGPGCDLDTITVK